MMFHPRTGPRGYDEITAMQIDAHERAVAKVRSLQPHAKAVLRAVERGASLEDAFGRDGDRERYKAAFQMLLANEYIALDGWIPRLTAQGKFARKHGGV